MHANRDIIIRGEKKNQAEPCKKGALMIRHAQFLTAILALVLTVSRNAAGELESPFTLLLGQTNSEEFTTPNREQLIDISPPSMTPSGNAVFGGFSSNWGIYASLPGEPLGEIVASGAQAPGTPGGVTFLRAHIAIATGNSQAAFFGMLTGTNVTEANNHGLWVRTPGGELRKVMRAGDPILGSEGGAFFGTRLSEAEQSKGPAVIRHSVNGIGDVAFTSQLYGDPTRDSNDRGVFLSDDDGLHLLARRGDPVPGATDGALFANFLRSRYAPSLNDHGDVAFAAGFSETFLDSGVFVKPRHGALRMVARAGDLAPGAETGVTYAMVWDPALNNQGQLVFEAVLQGEGVDDTNQLALFSGSPDQLTMVARSGATAPGTDAKFSSFGRVKAVVFDSPLINAQGRVAFVAHLSGEHVHKGNDTGIWTTDELGRLTLVAREGAPATGGGTFADLRGSFDKSSLQMGPQGQVAFAAFTVIDDSPIDSRFGLWATSIHGELQLLAREGTSLVFDSPSGMRSEMIDAIRLVTASGGQDGGPRTFSDRGEIVFYAQTGTTKSVFRSSAVAVPEPRTTWLTLTSLVVAARSATQPSKRR
jgi:hypothetical protein